MEIAKEMNPRIAQWLKLERRDYDLEYVKSQPLSNNPEYMKTFLGTFASFEDFCACAKSFLPPSLRTNDTAVNNALWNTEYMLADLGFPLKFLVKVVRQFPDFFAKDYVSLRDACSLFFELFYIEPADLRECFERFPQLLNLSQSEILNQVVGLCDLLQVSRLTIFDLVHKYPQILLKPLADINCFIVKVAKIFKAHQDDLRNAIFNDPSILDLSVDYVKQTYDTVYAKGFTRLELRRIFIKHYYNFKTPAQKICDAVDRFARYFDIGQKEAKTIVGDCPFVLAYTLPETHFDAEMKYRLGRKYLKKWQSEFLFPHQNYAIKLVFARVLGLEMQFSKILNTDLNKLFGRYFYLKETLGDGVNFSRDLWIQDYQFEEKYGMDGFIPAFARKPTMQDIENLFDDYNNKLQEHIVYHFPIEIPKNFVLPENFFTHGMLDEIENNNNLTAEEKIAYSFTALGFTGLEIQFLRNTMPRNKRISPKNISDIYEVFRKNHFSLFDTNWTILHNPAILDYHPKALANRFYTISCHHVLKFFCRAFPERI